MAESTIITGQFVRISQTPASIGERLLALAIDYSPDCDLSIFCDDTHC